MMPLSHFSLLVIEKFKSSLPPNYTIYNAYANYYTIDMSLYQQLSSQGQYKYTYFPISGVFKVMLWAG
jgi:hypothetical protein